jgi:hypothetical protein
MKIAQSSSIARWAPVLESDIGAPIRSQAEASILATLLENQLKLNKGALPESVNVTPDVQVYQQYALPLIRRQFPELLAMNTVAVIPTTTPQGIYFALRYVYGSAAPKTGAFRNGQAPELGFDLVDYYTGVGANATWYNGVNNTSDGYNAAYKTADGEYLSNYMEGMGINGGLGLNNPGTIMKDASIKVIRGTVLVGTRAIKSHYTLELQQDLAATHGQDIEALLLEALQFEIQQEIDREILAAMKYVATNPALGGEAVLVVPIDGTTPPFDGRWSAERIASAIVNTMIAVANKIAWVNHLGPANFAICSPDVVAAISTLNNGIYQPQYLGTDVVMAQAGGIAESGTIMGGQVKVYRDIYASGTTYALMGYKGPRQGESGIIFMPYIPYIFTKTAGQEDGSPRLIVKSRYAVVANLLGAGQFYRLINFTGINKVLYGFDVSSSTSPWQYSAGTYEPVSHGNLGGVGASQGDTNV